jgi:hypothetical protein
VNRKRLVLAILSSACLAASMLAGTVPVSARNGNFGRGGWTTGPTNYGASGFGSSTAARSAIGSYDGYSADPETARLERMADRFHNTY